MVPSVLTFIVASFLLTLPAWAADPTAPRTGEQGCWVEIFDDEDFDENDPHTRVQGPIELPSLKALNGRNWANDISSVMVGPHAAARAYSDRDYKGTELALLPGQRIGDLSELDMGNTIESLKIKCAT